MTDLPVTAQTTLPENVRPRDDAYLRQAEEIEIESISSVTVEWPLPLASHTTGDQMRNYGQAADDEEVVLVRGIPEHRGKALILTNKTEREHWKPMYDDAIFVMEQQLGLEVAEHDNLDIMALKRVKEFAESEHQGELVALAVMMYDYTDGDNSPQGTNPLPVQELVDALCNPKLEDKTKLIIVSLCRGRITPEVYRKLEDEDTKFAAGLIQSSHCGPIDEKVRKNKQRDHLSPEVSPPANCHVLYPILTDSKAPLVNVEDAPKFSIFRMMRAYLSNFVDNEEIHKAKQGSQVSGALTSGFDREDVTHKKDENQAQEALTVVSHLEGINLGKVQLEMVSSNGKAAPTETKTALDKLPAVIDPQLEAGASELLCMYVCGPQEIGWSELFDVEHVEGLESSDRSQETAWDWMIDSDDSFEPGQPGQPGDPAIDDYLDAEIYDCIKLIDDAMNSQRCKQIRQEIEKIDKNLFSKLEAVDDLSLIQLFKDSQSSHNGNNQPASSSKPDFIDKRDESPAAPTEENAPGTEATPPTRVNTKEVLKCDHIDLISMFNNIARQTRDAESDWRLYPNYCYAGDSKPIVINIRRHANRDAED